MGTFDIIAMMIFLAGLFLFVNTYFIKLPSSIGLMILALGLSVVVLIIGKVHPEYHLAENVKHLDYGEFMYRFVLSVLLFAGALNVNFHRLGKQLVPVLVLSFMGVLISTTIIGFLTYGLVLLLGIELSLLGCFVFGALISCTDPIAITKNIRRYRLSSALEAKVEGESLLNGGISIVLAFTLFNIYEMQQTMEFVGAVDVFMVIIQGLFGGLIVGILMGWVGYYLLKFVDNDVVEAEMLITMALVLTGSYLADSLSVSSILVAVLSGLIIGNFGRDDRTGESAVGFYVYKFWQLMEETVAAILFVLIGFEMLVIPIRMDYFAAGFFAVVIVVLARWIAMYIPIRMMSHLRSFDKGTVSVLTWGGLKGGLPVAFTLSLAEFPGRDILVTLTYIVVVCSLLYQGLTLGAVMKMYKSMNMHKLTIEKEHRADMKNAA